MIEIITLCKEAELKKAKKLCNKEIIYIHAFDEYKPIKTTIIRKEYEKILCSKLNKYNQRYYQIYLMMSFY